MPAKVLAEIERGLMWEPIVDRPRAPSFDEASDQDMVLSWLDEIIEGL